MPEESDIHDKSLHPAIIAGLAIAIIPFVVVVENIESVDGVVTYRNWVAVGCGLVAVLAAVFAGMGLARKTIVGPVNAGCAVIAMLLGGYHVAAGFGAFHTDGSGSETSVPETSVPETSVPETGSETSTSGTETSATGTSAAETTAPDVADQASASEGERVCDRTQPTTCEAPCAAGNHVACAVLGNELRRGELLPKDVSRAADLLEPACTQLDDGKVCYAAVLALYALPDDDVRRERIYDLEARGCTLDHPEMCNNHAVNLRATPETLEQAKDMAGKACALGSQVGCSNLLVWVIADNDAYDPTTAPTLVSHACGTTAKTAERCHHALTKLPPEAVSHPLTVQAYLHACRLGHGAACNEAGFIQSQADPMVPTADVAALYEKSCLLLNKMGCANQYMMMKQEEIPWDEAAVVTGMSKSCPNVPDKLCEDITIDLYTSGHAEAAVQIWSTWCAADHFAACANSGWGAHQLGQHAKGLQDLTRGCDNGDANACQNLARVQAGEGAATTP